MEAHRGLITRFGGIGEMARRLGHADRSDVQDWWDRAEIPMERWAEVDAAAERESIAFDMFELLPGARMSAGSGLISCRTLAPRGRGYRRRAAAERRKLVDDFAECLAEGGDVARCAARLGSTRGWGRSALIEIVARLGWQAR